MCDTNNYINFYTRRRLKKSRYIKAPPPPITIIPSLEATGTFENADDEMTSSVLFLT